MTIYEVIAKMAKEKEIPIYKLERAAGIGNGVIRRWGESDPSTSALRKVAAVLDCTIDDLLGD